MKDIDFTNYDVSYSTLSSRAKERLLDFYREDIKRNSIRGQLRELEDERKRIQGDRKRIIEIIQQWMYSTEGSFLEEIRLMFDHIHLDGEQKRIKQDAVSGIYHDVQSVVNRIFGGFYSTTYEKPPSVHAYVKDYKELFNLTCEFLKATGNEEINLQNRLDRAYQLHMEFKSKVAEEEQASMLIMKLKSGEIIGNEIESDLTDECISDLEIYAKEKPDLGIHPFFKSAQVRHPSCRKTKNGTEIGYRALETRIKKIRPDIYYRNIKRRKT